ncbi:hypothetical protein CPB85DRAFT_1375583 [Mucidula mucida]|nr:hypothetical protein CPB85DRAFT_1375583 [Mucidula mucida]
MSGSSSLRPVYIAGFSVIGAILIGVAIWLSIHIYRRRAQAKRDNMRGAGVLVRGNTFSRDQLTRSVVLPEKPDQDVLEYHRQSGMFPRAFSPVSSMPTPKPFSFALGAGNRGSVIKADRSSFLSVGSRYSILSTLSTASSIDSSSSPTARKVRQVFNPILPDELTVTPGERLTLVQSFDDGWCVVGRENKATGIRTKLFKKEEEDNDNVELGVIPAWCFIKPVKGLKAERPVRSTSLGITVQMDGPGFSSREELISWSNF